jgi:hypothetical protein
MDDVKPVKMEPQLREAENGGVWLGCINENGDTFYIPILTGNDEDLEVMRKKLHESVDELCDAYKKSLEKGE